MAEIFECAGTLLILLQSETSKEYFESHLSAEDLQSMAVAAAERALDRILDTHLIEVQERAFEGHNHLAMETHLAGQSSESSSPGRELIPTAFLDALLESVTLFGLTFGNGEARSSRLLEFVTEGFSSFLAHVRTLLLEESIQASHELDLPGQEDADSVHEEISGALSVLSRSVRDLASGLALPEIGIGADFASILVDQTLELTESMVRRRVDQKFQDLRLSVTKDCLLPFAERVVQERESAVATGKRGLPAMLFIVRSTLSDCLQLVDDSIRSILSRDFEASDSEASPDLPILKDAVQTSVRRFAFWLAGTLETMPSDPTLLIEAMNECSERNYEEVKTLKGINIQTNFDGRDDVSEFHSPNDDISELIDSIANKLRTASTVDEARSHTEFVLVIAELCRLAEDAAAEEMDASISTHLGGTKKKSRGLFPAGDAPAPRKRAPRPEDPISRRFQLAASRIIVLYATNQGALVASLLTEDLAEISLQDHSASHGPREATWKALEIVKSTSIECSTLIGGTARANSVQRMVDESIQGISSSVLGRKTGLQLDVERMFMEKISSIFPHPYDVLELSRDSILHVVFKVGFRPLVEQARLCTFSRSDFKQLQVDTEFLKHMLPHYIDANVSLDGSNACAGLSNLLREVMTNVGTRCLDDGCSDDDDLLHESRTAVRGFLERNSTGEIAKRFIIAEE
jgi:vacuolar protein sorting-associated protein 51